MTKEEIQIAQAACCVGKMWDEYEGTEDFDRMVGKRVQHLITLVRKLHPSLLFDLDETAKSCLKEALQKFYDTIGKPYALVNESEVNEFGEVLFRAGAVWKAGQGVKIGETKVYLEDDGDDPPYSQEWLDLETTEYQIPDGVFKNGDEVDVILRKKQ